MHTRVLVSFFHWAVEHLIEPFMSLHTQQYFGMGMVVSDFFF